MTIATRQRIISPRVLIMIVVLVGALVVATAYLRWQQSSMAPSTATDTSEPGSGDKTKLSDNPGASSSDQIPQKSGVIVTITELEQNGDKVIIEGTAEGATDGTCVVEFTTPNDQPVIGETAATKQGDGAKCGPITVPVAEFAYLGDWQAVLKLYTGGGKASSAVKTIAIK